MNFSHRVYVGSMTLETLDALSAPHVPNKNHFVATTRNKGVPSLTGREIDRHDVSGVSMEILQKLTALNVPKGARAVATTRQYLLIAVRKRTAGHVRRMGPDCFFPRCYIVLQTQRIDSNFVVQTPARIIIR